jgi:hypothetical protein
MKLCALMLTVLIFSSLMSSESIALETWSFLLSYESPTISVSGFELVTSADVDQNGIKEIIATDFGQFSSNYDKGYHLYILEWSTNQLKIKLTKHWDRFNPQIKSRNSPFGADFQAYKTESFRSWKSDEKPIVEAVPPFFKIEWDNGKYAINDSQVWESSNADYVIGSWAFPWLSSTCYPYFRDVHPLAPTRLSDVKSSHWLSDWRKPLSDPRECLVGIRDFLGNGNLKMLSIYQEEIVKDKEYVQQLRVRDLNKSGAPIEWQMKLPGMFYSSPIDRFNQSTRSALMLWQSQSLDLYCFDYDTQNKTYQLRLTLHRNPLPVHKFNLPDIYLRKTQKRDREEYWGYHDLKEGYGLSLWALRKVDIGPDCTLLNRVDIDYEHNEPFIGVIFFNVLDIDGDQVDEVVLVERTGIRKDNGESIEYQKAKEFVRILKWNGNKYQSMWVSPPYAKLGTTFLVDDVMNKGGKQLVIMSPYGTVQIWERH